MSTVTKNLDTDVSSHTLSILSAYQTQQQPCHARLQLDHPGLLVMDVDATLIEEEVIDILGEHHGCGQQMRNITLAAMRGELNFETSLRQRVQLLEGLPVVTCTSIAHSLHVTKGAQEVINTLHHHGWYVGAISGGFHQVLDSFLPQLSLDFWRANRLKDDSLQLNGKLIEPIINRSLKAETLRIWANKLHIPLSQTIAVGDGANDIAMAQTAGVGVAFCAKPALKAVADYCIEERDLSHLLTLFNVDH